MDTAHKTRLPFSPAGAVVLGATGAVGGNIVRALMESSAWPRIATLGRRSLPAWESHANRLTQHITDVLDPKAYGPLLAGHSHAFCAFGIGEPSKVNPERFQRVDIDAVRAFAEACRAMGIRHFTHMTSVGADPTSRIRYLRLKGGLEKDIEAMGFERTSHFRPSMLMTPVNRYGITQGFMLRAMPVFDNFLLGGWRKYRGIDVADLGKAMVRNAERPGKAIEGLAWDGFRKLLES